jgi:DNA polymerase III alpha subunit (gram-positive type)
MYIYVMMENLRKCSRCKSEIDLSYFGMSRKKEPYKTCDKCRNKRLSSSCLNDNITEDITKKCIIKEDLTHSDTDSVKLLVENKSKPFIIVFDIEHTGCSDSFILQLSWSLYQRDGTLIEMKDYYLNPEDEIYINPRASAIHGITFESLLMKENSLCITQLLSKFMVDVSQCYTLVAHNMKTDIKTLNKELTRHNMDIALNLNSYCTMAQTINYCCLKDVRGRVKNPRLAELYEKLFNEPMDTSKAHNGSYDVEICAKCYFKYLQLTNVDK